MKDRFIPGFGREATRASATSAPNEYALSYRQRESAIAALAQAGGKVSGVDGAAELLGIKPTTLGIVDN